MKALFILGFVLLGLTAYKIIKAGYVTGEHRSQTREDK